MSYGNMPNPPRVNDILTWYEALENLVWYYTQHSDRKEAERFLREFSGVVSLAEINHLKRVYLGEGVQTDFLNLIDSG